MITTVATFDVTEIVAGIASGVGSVSVAILPSLFTLTIPAKNSLKLAPNDDVSARLTFAGIRNDCFEASMVIWSLLRLLFAIEIYRDALVLPPEEIRSPEPV